MKSAHACKRNPILTTHGRVTYQFVADQLDLLLAVLCKLQAPTSSPPSRDVSPYLQSTFPDLARADQTGFSVNYWTPLLRVCTQDGERFRFFSAIYHVRWQSRAPPFLHFGLYMLFSIFIFIFETSQPSYYSTIMFIGIQISSGVCPSQRWRPASRDTEDLASPYASVFEPLRLCTKDASAKTRELDLISY
jgi:hypothetical protein